jgi:hypothetical protein
MNREVVPVRLSEAERAQIGNAARLQGLSFSGFLRQAALEVSARVTRKVEPVRNRAETRRPTADTSSRPSIFVTDESEPTPHWVDGERVDSLRKARAVA